MYAGAARPRIADELESSDESRLRGLATALLAASIWQTHRVGLPDEPRHGRLNGLRQVGVREIRSTQHITPVDTASR